MSITAELENIQEFESAGFTHEQAKVLTKTIERSHVDAQESLKDFIRNEIKLLRGELKADTANLKSDIESSLRDVLIKIFAIIFGTSGMLFAMLKLGVNLRSTLKIT